MNEKELISRCIKKDQKAMTELFYRYSYTLKTSCVRIMKNRDEADDVFQEGFIRIFSKLETFEFRSSLYSWMNRIMVNLALECLRKKNTIYTSMEIGEFDQVEEVNEVDESVFNYLDDLDSEEILGLLELLPDKLRIALSLFAIDGFKHSEISEKLGISVTLSRKLVSRARIKLIEITEERNYGHKKTGYTAAK